MIEIVELERTCFQCPSQWEGRDREGYPIYIRYRWGYLSIRRGDKGKSVNSAVCGEEIFGKHIGDSMDGKISFGGLRDLAKDAVTFSPEVSQEQERKDEEDVKRWQAFIRKLRRDASRNSPRNRD